MVIPGGFGTRGVEGKIQAVKYARENKIPMLGICLGMHCTVIEYARNVLGLRMPILLKLTLRQLTLLLILWLTKRILIILGGDNVVKIGAYPCVLTDGTTSIELYGTKNISERHRHRYEFNNSYKDLLKMQVLR